MSKIDVYRNLKLAIDRLYKNDYYLIKKCCERFIVFRLGIYLNQYFGWLNNSNL